MLFKVDEDKLYEALVDKITELELQKAPISKYYIKRYKNILNILEVGEFESVMLNEEEMKDIFDV